MPGPLENVKQLDQAVQAAEPGAVLVSPRILRRVIKAHRKIVGIGLRVPHSKSYVIDRDTLVRLVDGEALQLEPCRQLPGTVILLSRPDVEQVAALPPEQVLLKYWRRLFHARVHVSLEQRIAAGKLSETTVRDRINRIGDIEFEEIRSVLRAEHFLLPPRDERSVYVEFAAVYLELRYFAPDLLPRYFPGCAGQPTIDTLLAEDVAGGELFEKTRLKGAAEPAAAGEAVIPETTARFRLLQARAERAGAVGNVVKAALLRTRAARLAAQDLVEQTQAAARAEIERLVERLQMALGLDATEAEAWRQALAPLLSQAAWGLWPAEARLLYDLQKACTDHERPVFALDLLGWLKSLGRQPMRRPLPEMPQVLIVKDLRTALRHLRAAMIGEEERQRLTTLIEAAVQQCERRLHEEIRPLVVGVLDQVDLRPASLPERVARDKLTEELLDRIVARGYLNMGDLRDALSRNQLKLPDLSGAAELVLGDPLLRANRGLAGAVAGVYRGGEIYLRLLQRLSALAFATMTGRFVTRYVVIPFGGAYLALEGLQHLVQMGFDGWDWLRDWLDPESLPAAREELHFGRPLPVVLLGLVLLAIVHWGPFRRSLAKVFYLLYRGVRGVLIDLPGSILGLPVVRQALRSRPVVSVYHYMLKPLLLAAPVWLALKHSEDAKPFALPVGLVVFLAANLFLNSTLGRDLEEIFTDWLARAWQRLSVRIVPEVIRFTLALFHALLEGLDRLLYTVDEKLRFRRGDRRGTLAIKAVLAVFWSAISYILRLYVNLLIEPTVNPVKHFPTVTVAAKLLLPFVVVLMRVCAAPFLFLGPVLANTIALVTIHLIPGFFGFLVWELKENRRLYRANRARELRPVVIGAHGETMVRLLRPGFHSGTIPKLYARLRRAERRAHRLQNWSTVRRYQASLAHVEEAIHHFVERELLALVNGSTFWAATPVAVKSISIGSNRVRVELGCSSLDGSTWAIDFEERSGCLWAVLDKPTWPLSSGQCGALTTALTGWFSMAGVERVRFAAREFQAPGISWIDWVAAWKSDQAGKESAVPGLVLTCD